MNCTYIPAAARNRNPAIYPIIAPVLISGSLPMNLAANSSSLGKLPITNPNALIMR